MDLKKRKYKIIEALSKIEEPKIIYDLEEVLKINSEEQMDNDVMVKESEADIKAGRMYSMNEGEKMISDWNCEISEIEKLFIEAGLKDIKEEKIYTNEEVVREINKKYGL